MTTRAVLRLDALNIADAYGSGRWDTTAQTGEVDRRGGFAHAREWKRILNAAPWYRAAKRTPTADADGKIALSDLSSGSGDSQQRLYRVLLVAFNDTPYEQVDAASYVLAAESDAAWRCWYREGDYLVVPDSASTTATGVWVNHTPTPLHSLSTDSATVVLPDDYDDVLAYEWAAMILTKGAAETRAAAELKALAEEMRADLLSDIARISTKPLTFGYGDSPAEWGA